MGGALVAGLQYIPGKIGERDWANVPAHEEKNKSSSRI